MADIELDLELDKDQVERWQQLVGKGGRDAVDQLSIVAEAAMREEAPEGVGIPNVNMQTTIKPVQENRDPYRKSVAPRKKTEEGWPLHHAIIEGTTYTTSPPPLGPILAWAEGKISSDDPIREVAQNIRWSIFHDGHETFPNRFVDRSIREWESQTEQIAQDAVSDAFDRGGI